MSLSRRAPCHCGSGEKYKRCHLESDQAKLISQTPLPLPMTPERGYIYRHVYQCLKVRLRPIDDLVAIRLGDVVVHLTSRTQKVSLLVGATEITNDYTLNSKGAQLANVEFNGSVYLILSFMAADADTAAAEGHAKFEVALGYIEVLLGDRFVYNKLYEQIIDVAKRTPQFISAAMLNPGFFEFHEVQDRALEVAATKWDAFAALEIKSRNRLILAIRWYQRGLLERIADDRFLSFWIAFEVIAMRGAPDLDSGIDFTKDRLASNLTREQVKIRLGFGELFGCRNSIVHDGQAVMDHWDDERIIMMKNIMAELIRTELIIPPLGILNAKLQPAATE